MAISAELIESMAKDLYWQDAIPQGKALWRKRAEDAVTMWIANERIAEAFPNAQIVSDQ